MSLSMPSELPPPPVTPVTPGGHLLQKGNGPGDRVEYVRLEQLDRTIADWKRQACEKSPAKEPYYS